MHIYPWQIDPTSLQLSIDLWKTITPKKFHIYIVQCTYNHSILTPLQTSIDALNTTAPNLADLLADIYSTIHIYLWQIDPTPSSNQAEISAKP